MYKRGCFPTLYLTLSSEVSNPDNTEASLGLDQTQNPCSRQTNKPITKIELANWDDLHPTPDY